jgi:hypothetical protein
MTETTKTPDQGGSYVRLPNGEVELVERGGDAVQVNHPDKLDEQKPAPVVRRREPTPAEPA